MSLVYDVVEEASSLAKIKVIGVGGGGCNAINNMVANPIPGVEFISANTDAQSLKSSKATNCIQLGTNLTKGLGAGADPEVGREAALEDREAIADAIRGSDMLFITTGMGGGTGTGAAPVVAEIAKELGILTVAVVTRPFKYEGKRVQVAKEGLDALKKSVDSLIVIPNDKLLDALGEDVTLRDAFLAADDVLRNAVASISEIITKAGIVNLDFRDVQAIMTGMGMAMMGSGVARGVDRIRLATEQAISSPLLDQVTLDGAQRCLVNISTVPNGLLMKELDEVMSTISDYIKLDDSGVIKYGTAEDESMDEGDVRVTIIAAGLQDSNVNEKSASLRMLKTQQATGTDDLSPEISNVIRSGRDTRKMNLTALDFSNQSVVDDLEIPAVIRRQAD